MKRLTVFLSTLAIVCVFINATGLAANAETSGLDKAWSRRTLFENKDNAFIQKFALVGRAQLDSVWVNPKDEEKFNDTTWRRFRFGFQANMFEDWVGHLEANFDLNDPVDDWYTHLTDAYISWSPSNDLKIKVLKQSAGFTLDGATSSKRTLTLERNNLTNNLWFTKEYFNGILASGTFAGNLSYKASFFSSDGDPEWGWGDASWFTFWSMGYKFGNTKIRVDYVYQDEDENANTRPFEQILSLPAQWQSGRWGIWGDLSGGMGFSDQNQSDIWGLSLMPFYDIGEHTQIVVRYTHLHSQDDNGLRLNRYDNEIIDGKGDAYNEFLAGFNVYFYGHKFKWQTSVSWAEMKDGANDGGEYEGWTLSTGLRLYW